MNQHPGILKSGTAAFDAIIHIESKEHLLSLCDNVGKVFVLTGLSFEARHDPPIDGHFKLEPLSESLIVQIKLPPMPLLEKCMEEKQ